MQRPDELRRMVRAVHIQRPPAPHPRRASERASEAAAECTIRRRLHRAFAYDGDGCMHGVEKRGAVRRRGRGRGRAAPAWLQHVAEVRRHCAAAPHPCVVKQMYSIAIQTQYMYCTFVRCICKVHVLVPVHHTLPHGLDCHALCITCRMHRTVCRAWQGWKDGALPAEPASEDTASDVSI